MPVDPGTLPRVDPGQFGAVGGRDRRADRTVALSYTGALTQTACWEGRSQVCDEIRLTLAEVRRRTPSAVPAWGPRGTTPRLTVRGTVAGAPPPPPPPPPAFMEHPSPLPHSTAHRVYYTVPQQPLWNTPPPFPTALHTTCTTRYPTSFMEHPSPPSPQKYTPRVLHGTQPAFMEHPSPLPHSTAHRVYYTVPHQPLWNIPPPFPTALHTGCTTRYPHSLYGTPLPPSPQHCTPRVLHGTPPALWNIPPPFPTALHTRCTTRYPTSLYGTPLPPSPQHCTPGVLHGTPPAFMEHPSPLPHSTAHRVVYRVPHQPLWNTPPPFPTAGDLAPV